MDFLKIPSITKKSNMKRKSYFNKRTKSKEVQNMSKKYSNFSSNLESLTNPYQSIQKYSFKADKSIFNSRNIGNQSRFYGSNNLNSIPIKNLKRNNSSSDSKNSENGPYQLPLRPKPSNRYKNEEKVKSVNYSRIPLRLSNTLPINVIERNSCDSDSIDYLLQSSSSTKTISNRQYPFMPIGKEYSATCEKDFRNVKKLMEAVNNSDGLT